MPEIRYGHQRAGLTRVLTRLTIRCATGVTTFSAFSLSEIEKNVGMPGRLVSVIPLAVSDSFGKVSAAPRQRIALTIGNVDTPNLKRKGHAAFVEAASQLPDVKFVLVGEWRDNAIQNLRARAKPNVSFTGSLPRAELENYCRSAAVYVQPSSHEGFGLAVAEAMLAGCVPIVTRAGSLPEVVGDCGIYLPSQEPISIAEGIEEGLSLDGRSREKARQRILRFFPVRQRREALQALTERLMVRAAAV